MNQLIEINSDDFEIKCKVILFLSMTSISALEKVRMSIKSNTNHLRSCTVTAGAKCVEAKAK